MDKDNQPKTHVEQLNEPKAAKAANEHPSTQMEKVLDPMDSASTTVKSENDISKNEVKQKLEIGKENAGKTHAEKEIERNASNIKSQDKGGVRGGRGGGGGFRTPGQFFNGSDKLDEMLNLDPFDDNEPLSMNQEQGEESYQSPQAENEWNVSRIEGNPSIAQNDEGIQNPLENSNDRLASFFRDEKQEVEMDDLAEISDKQKEALYLAFNENAKNLPEIEDENSGFQPEQNDTIEYGDNDRMATFFRGDKQEVEVDDLREISDGQKESLYLAFNENGKNLPEAENDSRNVEPEQNETAKSVSNDRTAAFFRGDDQEVEMNDLPEISDEQKESLYLAFNESETYAEKEDYFPIDKSATLDFAVSDNKEVDMIADGPDMGDAGGGDGGGDGD